MKYYKGTYYKGCNFNTKESKIINDFKEGVHIDYNKNEKIYLSDKINSFNEKLIRKANIITSDFATLIIVESMLKTILKNVLERNVYFSVQSNITRLIVAQSKTIKVYKSYRFHLKKYGISHKDTFDVFNNDTEKRIKRYEANKNIIKEWLLEYGFEKIITIIEEKSGKTFFEYALDFENNYYSEILSKSNSFDIDEDKNEYYCNVGTCFFEHLDALSKENGLDLREMVIDATNIIFERNQEKRKEILEKERKIKKEIKISNCKKIADNDNTRIFKGVNDCSNFERLMFEDYDAFKLLREQINSKGNNVYYVAIVAKTRVQYLKGNNSSTTTQIHCAKLFGNEDKGEIEDAILKAKELYPTRYVAAYNISMC